jgi:hypothetical protein
MAWQDYYSSLAGGIPLYQPNLLATLQALRTPMPQIPMPQQQPQQQGGGINISGAKDLIKALRGGSSGEAARANAVHSLGPITSAPLATSGLGQAQATQLLTSPAAYGGAVPLTTSGLSGAEATGILTSPAAYGTAGGISGASVTGGAAGAGLGGGAALSGAGGISGASVTGGAAGAGLGGGSAAGGSAALSAAPALGAAGLLALGAYSAFQHDKRPDLAWQMIQQGKGAHGPNGLQIVSVGGKTYIGGDPQAVSDARAVAERRGIGTFAIGNMVQIGANLPNTMAAMQDYQHQLNSGGVAPYDPSIFSDYRPKYPEAH